MIQHVQPGTLRPPTYANKPMRPCISIKSSSSIMGRALLCTARRFTNGQPAYIRKRMRIVSQHGHLHVAAARAGTSCLACMQGLHCMLGAPPPPGVLALSGPQERSVGGVRRRTLTVSCSRCRASAGGSQSHTPSLPSTSTPSASLSTRCATSGFAVTPLPLG